MDNKRLPRWIIVFSSFPRRKWESHFYKVYTRNAMWATKWTFRRIGHPQWWLCSIVRGGRWYSPCNWKRRLQESMAQGSLRQRVTCMMMLGVTWDDSISKARLYCHSMTAQWEIIRIRNSCRHAQNQQWFIWKSLWLCFVTEVGQFSVLEAPATLTINSGCEK